MAPEPPTRRPNAALGSDSPSTEDSSSSSGDEHEAEQRPTANPSVPAPTGFSTSSEEESSASGDEHEAEQRLTANPSVPAPTGFSTSSEEDSSASGDEHEAEERPTTNPSIPAPAGQEDSSSSSSSSGDEHEAEQDDDNEDEGSSNVAAKRGPSPPPQLQGLLEPQTPPEGNVPSPKLTNPSSVKRTAAAAELGEPSPLKKKKKKKKAPADVPSKSSPPEKPAAPGEDQHTKLPEKAVAAKKVAKLLEKAVAAKKVAKLPEKAVAAKNIAEPPPRKKAVASGARQAAGNKVAKKPPPSKAVAAVARQPAGKEVAYNAEKHLEKKRNTYWHLAQVVDTLDREHNTKGIYNTTFRNISDDKAAVLNAKIKKQTMDEAKLFLKRCDIKREVIRAMSDTIK